MNWRMLDLNLLDAVAQEQSATRAARLNTSQSSISHALGRLRLALGDQLFVWTPNGMEPTPYCARIAGPIRAVLQSLDATLDGAAAFDPAESTRAFVVAVDNRAALVLGPTLAAAVAAQAANVALHLRPSGTLDVGEHLDRGDIDLALGGLSAPGERFADRRLFASGSAALVRQGHPAAEGGAISLKALAAYPHLLPSSTGEATDFVDAAMARHGLVRRVGLRAPLLTAIGALTQSDMIAIVNEDAARAFADLAPLTVLPLPFASPRLPTAMLWHRRFDDVSAHRWLRDLVLRLVRRAPDSDDRRSAAERQSADAADRNPSRDGEEVS